jgi:hypothetical protein
VPDGIDTAMHRVEEPAPDTVIDCPGPEPEIDQLPARHHTVLRRGDRRDLAVPRARGTLTPYYMPNVPLDQHVPIVARPA